MSSLKRWTQVGQGQLSKWTEPGQALEGVYQGTSPGKFGDLGTVQQDDGQRISFPIHTALATRLGQVKVGAEVRIEYVGKRQSKGGQEYKDFNVFVASPEDIAPPRHEDEAPDDDVPF